MNSTVDTQTNDTSFEANDQYFISDIQRSITIPVLIVVALPSIVLTLFIFYHLLKFRKSMLYNRMNHHVVLLILICDFLLITTELPISLNYLALGQIQTVKMCTFWIYWDYTLQATSLILTMYASIERYLLVFYKHTLNKHKILLHFVPTTIATIYIPTLYLYMIVLFPCVSYQEYDLTAFICGGSCYLENTVTNAYDTIVDTAVPCLIIVIFNLLIITRVSALKRRVSLSNPHMVSRNRRMILQLLGISLMCLIAWIPWLVIAFVQKFFDPSFGIWLMAYILNYLPYLTTSISPYFALIGFPEIRKQMKIRKTDKQHTLSRLSSIPMNETAIVSRSQTNNN